MHVTSSIRPHLTHSMGKRALLIDSKIHPKMQALVSMSNCRIYEEQSNLWENRLVAVATLLAGETSDDESNLYEHDLEEMSE